MANQQLLPSNTVTIAWYRQFWPWFLIILPGIVVVASLITVFIAFKHADTLVVDNYYKEGRGINKTFAKINTAKSFDIKGSVVIQDDRIDLLVSSNRIINDDEILLAFSHPFDNKKDFSIKLKNAGNGLYRADFPKPLEGKWYLNLQSVSASSPWQINQTVEMPAVRIEFSAL